MAERKGVKRLTMRPVVKGLTLDDIKDELWGMQDVCSDVAYAIQDEDIIEDALGSEEEAFEFRMAFSDIQYDLERMCDALREEWVPEYFDTFLPALRAGQMYSYDEYTDDFAPISAWESEWEEKQARETVKRLTKDQLIDAAAQCLSVIRMYIALRYRFDCLSGALDIIRGVNRGIIDAVNAINEAHEKGEYERIDNLALYLPPDVWVM